MSGTMSDGSPITPELDARMLADLREWRARIGSGTSHERWSMRLTLDELDLLLRIAAERDALKRELVNQWTADIPAEVRLRALPGDAGILHGRKLGGDEIIPIDAIPNGATYREVRGAPLLRIAAEVGGGSLCGIALPSHVTDGVRYADCPECIRRAEAGS